MIKRILSAVLSLIILCSSFTLWGITETQAADDTMSTLAALTKKFPADKYWNHMGSPKNSPDTVTDVPCASHIGCSWQEDACSCNSFDRSIQCMGYAHKIAYEITGVMPRGSFTKSTKLSVSSLRVGDIIRFRNDRHSICVTGVNGSQISFTDCNWGSNCIIRWGVMDISYITSRGFSYVLHLEGNNRKNTDLEFFNHPEKYLKDEEPEDEDDKEDTVTVSQEIWQMSDSNLNVRSSASVSASKVGSIPAGASFTVKQKKHTADYLWGYVEYGSIKGWAALNYSEYVSGSYQTPEINNAKAAYESKSLTLSWDEVSGSEKYLIRLYDSSKKLISQNYVSGNEYSFSVEANGKYYAKVYTKNSHAASWIIAGKLIGFTVNEEEIQNPVSSIVLSDEKLTLICGKSAVLTAAVEPSELSEEVVWSTTDDGTVSVENGKITALSCGKATIVCADKTGKVKAECTVTVKPENVSGIVQNLKSTTTDSITFTWDEVSCADSYDIFRYNASEKKYEKLANVDENEYTDTSVSASKSYYYLVRAVADTDDGIINGANTKVKLSTRPEKVTGLKQSSSLTGRITLSWNKVENVSLYSVYKYNSATKKYTKVKNVKTEKLTLTVEPSEAAYYRVYATTKTSWGYLYSAVSSKAYTVAGPSAPEISVKSNAKGSATISWDSIDGTKYYYVYRYTSSGYKRIAIMRNGETEYTDTSLKSGSRYYYRVRAVTVKGGVAGYSSYSQKASVKVK